MSRIRLAKIATPAAPPTSAIELFYSTTLGGMCSIDEFGNVVQLTNTALYRLLRVFWIVATGAGTSGNNCYVISSGTPTNYGASQTIAMTAGTRALFVEAVGGGGGGGSANITSSNSSAAGGGAAGAYAGLWVPSPLAAPYSVTLGVGGSAGASGGSGGTGGDTLFGSIVTAKGGNGSAAGTTAGTSAAVSAGGTSQAGSVGDIVIPGSFGGNGVVISGTLAAAGNGGGSMFSPAGNAGPIWVLTTAGGRGAGAYGGGGPGAANVGTQSTAQSGAAGTAGAVRVWEFA